MLKYLPNPNSINNAATGDPNGVAFIDDFEGSKRTTSPSIQRRFWKESSVPFFYDDDLSIFEAPFLSAIEVNYSGIILISRFVLERFGQTNQPPFKQEMKPRMF